MSRILAFKLGAIALLILLLMIPLTMIDGLVNERQYQREGVLQDIARSSSYRQQITGPILVLPYTKVWHEWKTHSKTGERYMHERQSSRRSITRMPIAWRSVLKEISPTARRV